MEARDAIDFDLLDKADIHWLLGLYYYKSADLENCEIHLQRSRELAPSSQCEWVRFFLELSRNQFTAAMEAFECAHRLAVAEGDRLELRWFENPSLLACASVFNDPNDVRTDEALQRANLFLETLDWPTGQLMYLSALAGTLLSRGDTMAALKKYSRTLDLAVKSGNHFIAKATAWLIAGFDDPATPAKERLATAVSHLKSELKADAQMCAPHYPLAIRSIVVGLIECGEDEVAARCSRVVDTLKGHGSSGEYSPRYLPLLGELRDRLGTDRFDHLQQEGERLDVQQIVEIGERVLSTL